MSSLRKLPTLGISKLPKIGNPVGLHSPKGVLGEKESQKIRDLSKAYKVNISSIDEMKDRYLMPKRQENNNKNKLIGIKPSVGVSSEVVLNRSKSP